MGAGHQHLDADEEHVLWLAPAATQSRLGRLDEEVKTRAHLVGWAPSGHASGPPAKTAGVTGQASHPQPQSRRTCGWTLSRR